MNYNMLFILITQSHFLVYCGSFCSIRWGSFCAAPHLYCDRVVCIEWMIFVAFASDFDFTIHLICDFCWIISLIVLFFSSARFNCCLIWFLGSWWLMYSSVWFFGLLYLVGCHYPLLFARGCYPCPPSLPSSQRRSRPHQSLAAMPSPDQRRLRHGGVRSNHTRLALFARGSDLFQSFLPSCLSLHVYFCRCNISLVDCLDMCECDGRRVWCIHASPLLSVLSLFDGGEVNVCV